MTNSAQNVSNDAVSGLNPLSYLNQNQPATVLRVSFPRAPTTADKRFKLGTMWLDTSSDSSYQLIRVLNNAAQWAILGPGTTNLDQLDGDSGSATPTAGVITIAGGTGITTSATGSTVTINSAAGMASISEFIVAADGSADYTTIQAAITAASSGDAVYVRPATYTEDLTLKAGVSLVGAGGAFGAAVVTIAGTHLPPATGNVSFDGFTLSDATTIVSSAAAGTGSVTFENCQINVTTGYCCDLVSWTGTLSWQNCGFGGTTDGVTNNTGGSDQNVANCAIGSGSANAWSISGALDMQACEVGCPMNLITGATSTSIVGSKILDPVTLSNDSAGVIYSSTIVSGASAAITMSSSGAWDCSEITLDSSNTNAIAGAGAGTVTLGQLSFLDSSGIAATLTIDGAARQEPMSRFVVDGAGNGDYITIQAAITAADAAGGGLVFVRPGTYTEDLTLADDVHIFGSSESATIIAGTHTPPASGTVNLFRCIFTDAAAIFSSAAAGTTTIILEDSTVDVTTGYAFNLANWAGTIAVFDLASTGTTDGFINNTGGATIFATNSTIGAGTANDMITSGTITLQYADVNCPLDCQAGTVASVDFNVLRSPITFSDDSEGTMDHCRIEGGASAGITMSSSGAWTVTDCTIRSSNNPALDGAGAGTLTIGELTFLDNSALAATLTTSLQETLTGTSFATIFDTNVAAAACTLSGTTLAADGTDADITLTLTPKGTGTVTVDSGGVDVTAGDIINSHGSVSGDVTIEVTNTDNTMADSRAGFEVTTGGTSAGDPYVNFLINGGQAFTMGIDNSTTNDDFVISDGAALGTGNVLSIDGSTSDVTVSTGNLIIGAVAKQLQMNGGAVTDFIGQATMTLGVATVGNTNIKANDRVYVTRTAINTPGALGFPTVTVTPSTGFVITALSPADGSTTITTDVSTFDYIIVGQN